MQTPRDIHLDCAKRILRYVRGTMGYGILHKAAIPIQLDGYTDADWAGYKADRRSTSGFVFSLGIGAISWSSKKQPTVALSSIEAENRDVAMAACEAVWVEDTEGSGRTHQGSDSPLLRQYEHHLSGSEPGVPRADKAY